MNTQRRINDERVLTIMNHDRAFPRRCDGSLCRAFICLLALCIVAPCNSLNILVTNDDGFEASTIHALYRVLKAKGHSVIISSEVQDNSGKGGAADFFRPIGNLVSDSRAGHIRAGAPGVGTLPGDEDVHYVDGTPVTAALYGIDIAALRKWGSVPDLVISGPNYGNNTGLINNSSGTVNAALICINRGVPAIAVSTATPKNYKSFEELADTDAEYAVAGWVVAIVYALAHARRTSSARLLPLGFGLNVNIPAFDPSKRKSLIYKISDVGNASAAVPVFAEDLSQDAGARSFGIKAPALPGVSLALPGQQNPLNRAMIVDGRPASEQNIVNSGAIAISVIQGNHQASLAGKYAIKGLLPALLSK